MTRSQLIEVLTERLDLDHQHADAIVRTVFDSMRQALRHGCSIELRGFGSFSIRRHRAYRGRNPRSGQRVVVPRKVVPYFKVGKPMRARIDRTVAPRRLAESVVEKRPPESAGARPLAARHDAE